MNLLLPHAQGSPLFKNAKVLLLQSNLTCQVFEADWVSTYVMFLQVTFFPSQSMSIKQLFLLYNQVINTIQLLLLTTGNSPLTILSLFSNKN